MDSMIKFKNITIPGFETYETVNEKIYGRKEIVYKDSRPGDSKISIADTTKMINILGNYKITTIEEGICYTKEFYKSLNG